MKFPWLSGLLFGALAFAAHGSRAADASVATNLIEEIRLLRARLEVLETQVAAMTAQQNAQAAAPRPESTSAVAAARRSIQSLNPDVSVIVDTFFHADNSKEGISHVTGKMAGFGHAHAEGEEHHHGVEDGFNLRHLELQFTADVDPYFKGSAIAAVDLEGAEMEEAVIETTSLPWGFKLKGGKFFSDFGYINAQHSHQWDFADRPLIHQLTLGEHGLNDKGLQLSWLAPTPFYLLAGVEVFQGENENMFAHHGEAPLSAHDGPRVGVGWVKFGPNLPGRHGLQFGLFGGLGRHQEEHDGQTEDPIGVWTPGGDGIADHWLDGESYFWGGDVVYKYDAPLPGGQGDFVWQAEYLARRKDLEMAGNNFAPGLIGNSRVDDQDGYYIQAVYGILPRWRAGVRWDQVGLINQSELPDGTREEYGSSYRMGAMLDFTPSEFSRIRLQANHGSFETEEGSVGVSEVFVQWMISLGAHGAHKF
jgi:hypothetical protein